MSEGRSAMANSRKLAQAKGVSKTEDAGRNDESAPSAALTARLGDELLQARTLLLFGEIDMAVAEGVCARLLALARRSDEPIRLVINSPGGHVESGDTIFDTIRFIRPSVQILGTGWVVSAAALVYVAVEREQRLALPNTRFMLHQPLGGVGGPASDIEIEARQISSLRERLNRTFASATGQPYERIVKDTERNHWMTATEAVAYGLAGRIVQHESEL